MTEPEDLSVTDVYLATARALGLDPRKRREGLDQIAAAHHTQEGGD